MERRPPYVRNVRDLPSSSEAYPGDDELMSEGTPLSRPLGLTRLGIHHERLAPGRRTSWPHAEEKEEEFVYVLEGTPDVWLDGALHRLEPGDVVAFVPGTGIAHTFLNDTDRDVRLLVVGERLPDNRISYPRHPNGWEGMAREKVWTDVPDRDRGPHDGVPRLLREARAARGAS
jgi:uncharacterized cupin superfamily protein